MPTPTQGEFESSKGLFPSLPATAPATPSDEKENQTSTPSKSTAPKTSSFSLLAKSGPGGNASPPVSLVPQKRGFEDQLIDLQRNMIDTLRHRSEEEQVVKRRKANREERKLTLKERNQLMLERKELREEFQLGVYTITEYRERLTKLDLRLQLLEHAQPEPTRTHTRSPSPDWNFSQLEADMSAEQEA
ncbi:hypothetical protein K435DRAFT_787628 [Dendrothele bispora CBS 962.96]|uniref:Uncharacterized protein n=1 Tax=Dendrothele bispora (strain CBS 962.96) TaxID=1314807 RepID=A0A4S8KID7_DENBC|nr:hypothetical protein K435DRAFT_787628 [Dendrothele bispora CBS 962.96]